MLAVIAFIFLYQFVFPILLFLKLFKSLIILFIFYFIK